MTRLFNLSVAVFVAALVFASSQAISGAGQPSPSSSVSANSGNQRWNVSAAGHSGDRKPGDNSRPGPASRTYDCGAPLPNGVRTGDGLDPCAQPQDTCKGQATTDATGKPTATMVHQTQNADGSWSTVNFDCVVGAPTPQDPIAAAARDAFTKLVPHATISAAAQHGVSLVNAETLYWLDTPTTVDLGTTPLLGQPVQLLATVATVHWNFGDGHTATSQGPGRPFTTTDHCNTTTCPDWFGHTYTDPAPNLTVTATTTWTGRYSINGGPFTAITGTVTAPPATIPMQVDQSLAILVPNPGETG
jgi:hypothetical protein